MDFHAFFKGFFNSNNTNNRERPPPQEDNQFLNPIWGEVYTSDDEEEVYRAPAAPSRNFGFQIFSEPFAMHEFFEQQLDDIMKQFGRFGLDNNHGQAFGFGGVDERGTFGNPAITGPQPNLRDQYLKPGYLNEASRKEDSDLDGQISPRDLEQLYPSQSAQIAPHNSNQPSFFSKSVLIRTIRKPDGSVETRRTVRDHTGREETTIIEEPADNMSTRPLHEDDDNAIFKHFFPIH